MHFALYIHEAKSTKDSDFVEHGDGATIYIMLKVLEMCFPRRTFRGISRFTLKHPVALGNEVRSQVA